MPLSRLTDITLDALRSAGAYFGDITTPTVRLGVTGLSRAGKTVLITAIVRNLTQGGRLPFFSPVAEGRLLRAYLEPQPDDDVPRFDYEAHLAQLTSCPPVWPEGTRRISQLRLTIEYETAGFLRRQLGPARLHVDMVDYPGEWLIDLGLLEQSYAAWSAEALRLARMPSRRDAASRWLAHLATLDADAEQNESVAQEAARIFTGYLTAARAEEPGVWTLGPGRFLMPGDLAGSPLLTFAPLVPGAGPPARGSLAGMMERRFESYKTHVVKPFFHAHFSRMDRQIVLVDALAALNAGGAAVAELTRALEACLRAFRPGRATWLASILGRPIDRILFAATKADHLHQSSHDRLESALRRMTGEAAARAGVAGASVGVVALAALRATREAEVRHGTEHLACIVGVPLKGERIGDELFDGTKEAVVFPGDLPADPATADTEEGGADIQIARFRPPVLPMGDASAPAPWPHIRLDRALDFLLGDRLA